MYQDKTLVCRDCGKEFVFTVGEQEFYAEKGFQNEPTRCRECRMAHKAARNSGAPRVMYDAVCAECGQPTKVPSSREKIVRSIAASATPPASAVNRTIRTTQGHSLRGASFLNAARFHGFSF